MKRTANKLVRDEKGQAMILVVLLLLVGALIITPLLGFMGTGLMAGQINETKMAEFYAADAGVENGLWELIIANLDVPEGTPATLTPFTMNALTVNTTIVKIVGEPVYRITATAGNSTIEVYLIRTMMSGGDFTLPPGDRIEEDVFYTGDIVMGVDSEIRADVIALGNLTMNGGDDETEIRGDVCVGGDLILNGEIRIRDSGNVYVAGNIIVNGDIQFEGTVYTNFPIQGSSYDLEGGGPLPYEGCPMYVEGELLTWDIN